MKFEYLFEISHLQDSSRAFKCTESILIPRRFVDFPSVFLNSFALFISSEIIFEYFWKYSVSFTTSDALNLSGAYIVSIVQFELVEVNGNKIWNPKEITKKIFVDLIHRTNNNYSFTVLTSSNFLWYQWVTTRTSVHYRL